MAVPKRKLSKSRKRLRRGHHTGAGMATQPCSRCSAPKLSHRVCPSCGYYAGKKRVEVEDTVARMGELIVHAAEGIGGAADAARG